MDGLCVSYWWSMSQTAFIISHRHIFLRHAQYLQKTLDMSVFFLPRETLAGTARRSIQNDTHESITMSVAGKYVCSRKKKMWRRNVKLMQRRLYQPANAAREQLTCGGTRIQTCRTCCKHQGSFLYTGVNTYVNVFTNSQITNQI